MADYQKIIPLSLAYEGDRYTNIPKDKGGATKYGISMLFAGNTNDLELFDLDHDNNITNYDIKLMTEEVATEAFKKYFWDRCNLDEMESDKKAFVVFDSLINNGIKNAARMSQRTCNKLGYNLVVDAAWGPKTFNAVNSAIESEFVKVFLNEREAFFKRIVQNNPSQKIFLKGWLNRIKWNKRDVLSL